MTSWSGRALTVVSMLWLGTVAGCVQDSAEPGAFSSPSELGLSLGLSASPDILPLDGAARSLITIVARGANGESVPGLRLRLQLGTDVGLADYGQLSAREVTTGQDGRATATYTAPLQPTSGGAAPDEGEVVTIWVTPVADNFDNAIARALTIRLVPSGAVIPSFGATAGFAFTPATPAAFTDVLFTTACADETSLDCVRDPNGVVSSYHWSFGDGDTGTGPTAHNAYDEAGTYLVTLTISDRNGRSTKATRSVVVSGGTPPTAGATFSPEMPGVGVTVFFNATASTAAPGRTLSSYTWDFGDGTSSTGLTTSHSYGSAGTYVVTLSVTDDEGQIATTTLSVPVT